MTLKPTVYVYTTPGPDEARYKHADAPGKYAGMITQDHGGVAWRITKARGDWRTGVLQPIRKSQNLRELEEWGLPKFGLLRLRSRKTVAFSPPKPRPQSAPLPKAQLGSARAKEVFDYTAEYPIVGRRTQELTGEVRKVEFRASNILQAWEILDQIMTDSRVPLVGRPLARLFCGKTEVERV